MGFPSKIKQEALRLSARHCSVFHRYKGIKMEVHHLIQEADGGPNTLENAIPLCFDRHSGAGHFNNRHPKGSKFSIPELPRAWDSVNNWLNDARISKPEFVITLREIEQKITKQAKSSIDKNNKVLDLLTTKATFTHRSVSKEVALERLIVKSS